MNVKRFNLDSQWTRAGLVGGATAAYTLAFFPLYRLNPSAGIAALSCVPVAVAAWLFGARAGLLTSLLAWPLNTLLLVLVGHEQGGWDVILRSGGGVGEVALIVVGLMVGRLRDLGERVKEELAERQQAEVALRESEARLRTVLLSAPLVLWALDREGVFTLSEGKGLAALGLAPGEIVGQSVFEIYRDTPQILEDSRRALAGEAFTSTVDVASLTFESRFSPVRDQQGNVSGVIGVAIDITEGKRAEVALAESENRLRTIVQSEPECVKLLGPNGALLEMNPAGLAMIEADSLEQVIGVSILNIVTPEHRAAFAALNARVFAGESGTLEFEIVGLKGTRRWLETHAVPLRNTAGAVSALLGVTRNITQRRQAEDALRQSEERYRTIFQTAEVSIWEEDFSELKAACEALKAHGVTDFPRYLTEHPEFTRQATQMVKVRDVNNATLKLLGAKDKTELLGSLDKVFVPETLDIFREEVLAIAEGRSHFEGETINQTLQGKRLNIWLTMFIPVETEKFGNVLVSLIDITERKRAEDAARRRANEFAALYDTTRDLATQQDLSTLLATIAQRATTLLGVPNASITLYDPARGDLEIAATLGPDLPIGTHRPLGDGLAGRVAQSRAPLMVEDYHRWEHQSPLFEAIPYAAMMGVPLLYRGELLGVVDVSEIAPSTRLFTEADARLLSLFAGQAASAVYNARLIDAIRRRLAELEAVNRISTALRAAQTLAEMLPILLEATLSTLDAPTGSILLYDSTHDELQAVVARGWFEQVALPVKPGEGISGRVFTTGQPYISRDFKTDPQTLDRARAIIPAGWGGACVPIRTAHEVVGALFVSALAPRAMGQSEVSLLTILAEIAGNAVHRMRLHEQTEQRLHRLSALRAVDIAIAGSLDLHITLTVLLDHLTDQLGVDAAAILLLKPHAQVLEYAAGRGFRRGNIQRTRLRLGEGSSGRATLERRMVTIPDLRATPSEFTRLALIEGEGFITYYGLPLIAKAEVKGVLEIFQRTPLVPDPDWLDFLETLAGQAAIAVDSAQLFDSLQRSNMELTLAYDTTIEGWSRALDLRDKETEGHTLRVTEMTVKLARALGLGEAELVHLRRGALLHDIGKMGVPDGILLKPGKLTEEEWVSMRRHPMYAYDMLLPIAYLRPALDIPYCHHEKWDGTGYPRGLKGEQIPLAARLFAVVDVWDALRSDRPYRAGWPEDKVLEHIQANRLTHFDPHVVEVFLKMLTEEL